MLLLLEPAVEHTVGVEDVATGQLTKLGVKVLELLHVLGCAFGLLTNLSDTNGASQILESLVRLLVIKHFLLGKLFFSETFIFFLF